MERKGTQQKTKTDWNTYYSNHHKLSVYTHAIVRRSLLSTMRKYIPPDKASVFIELGGANSCFYEKIVSTFQPREYHIVDNNSLGLEKFRSRVSAEKKDQVHFGDVLNFETPLQSDIVLSAGLIEHFNEDDTARAIQTHFRLLRPGGLAFITFPTPTWLYQFARLLAEKIEIWPFHDERPLGFSEVVREISKVADVVFTKITWAMIFTQGLVVARSADAPSFPFVKQPKIAQTCSKDWKSR
jgi:predicted SAM-dependent methyltransferase